MIEIETTFKITHRRISDMLCNAFEGGSNYWYTRLDAVLPEGISLDDFRRGGKYQPGLKDYYHWAELVPLQPGCRLTLIDSTDETEHFIDLEKIKSGLEIFIRDHPKHFADMMSETDDAITGDVLLQCIVFGKVIYG